RRFTAHMTTQRNATLAALADTGERDPHASVAPAVATALLAVLGPAAVMFGGLSAMATDSCGPDDCSSALTTSLTWIYGMLSYGTPVAVTALPIAWRLPRGGRWAAARHWAAVIALVPPLTVLFLVLTLPAP